MIHLPGSRRTLYNAQQQQQDLARGHQHYLLFHHNLLITLIQFTAFGGKRSELKELISMLFLGNRIVLSSVNGGGPVPSMPYLRPHSSQAFLNGWQKTKRIVSPQKRDKRIKRISDTVSSGWDDRLQRRLIRN